MTREVKSSVEKPSEGQGTGDRMVAPEPGVMSVRPRSGRRSQVNTLTLSVDYTWNEMIKNKKKRRKVGNTTHNHQWMLTKKLHEEKQLS